MTPSPALPAENGPQRSLAANPGDAAGWINLGCARHVAGRLATAAACYRRALRLLAGVPPLAVFHNLALALLNLGDWAGLAACCRAAAAAWPDDGQTLTLLGNALVRLGRYPAALRAYSAALTLAPANAGVRCSRGVIRLLTGDFPGGWADHAARWIAAPPRPPAAFAARPRWSGGPVPPNGRLLLWGEPGLGDEILYASLIPELVAAGAADLVVECDARLIPLLRRSLPGIETIPRSDPPSPRLLAADIAAQAPLSDLPATLRPTREAFPPAPPAWMIPDPDRTAAFRRRYGGDRPCIGVSWLTAADPARSAPLNDLLCALSATGARLVATQAGADAAALADAGASDRLILPADVDPWNDLDGFAALVAAMDLVATIDNTTLHVAGATGTPTLALLPAEPAWFWGLGAENCLWYPQVRLLRQQQAGSWRAPLAALGRLAAAALDARPSSAA